MAKAEMGIKRICLSCAAKFYDLEKDPIICPSCGVTFDPEAAIKLKRGRTPANDDKTAKKPEVKAEAETEEDEIELDDEDEDVLEDTSDLDDDDDVPGVPSTEKDDES